MKQSVSLKTSIFTEKQAKRKMTTSLKCRTPNRQLFFSCSRGVMCDVALSSTREHDDKLLSCSRVDRSTWSLCCAVEDNATSRNSTLCIRTESANIKQASPTLGPTQDNLRHYSTSVTLQPNSPLNHCPAVNHCKVVFSSSIVDLSGWAKESRKLSTVTAYISKAVSLRAHLGSGMDTGIDGNKIVPMKSPSGRRRAQSWSRGTWRTFRPAFA